MWQKPVTLPQHSTSQRSNSQQRVQHQKIMPGLQHAKRPAVLHLCDASVARSEEQHTARRPGMACQCAGSPAATLSQAAAATPQHSDQTRTGTAASLPVANLEAAAGLERCCHAPAPARQRQPERQIRPAGMGPLPSAEHPRRGCPSALLGLGPDKLRSPRPSCWQPDRARTCEPLLAPGRAVALQGPRQGQHGADGRRAVGCPAEHASSCC